MQQRPGCPHRRADSDLNIPTPAAVLDTRTISQKVKTENPSRPAAHTHSRDASGGSVVAVLCVLCDVGI